MNKQFLSYLKKLEFSKLVSLWNNQGTEYCRDNYLYNRKEFRKLYGLETEETASMPASSKTKNRENYFYFDNGTIKKCWNLRSSPIDLELLAEILEENYHEIWIDYFSKY